MGNLINNKDGTHTFVGGFNSRNQSDLKQMEPVVREGLGMSPLKKAKKSKK